MEQKNTLVQEDAISSESVQEMRPVTQPKAKRKIKKGKKGSVAGKSKTGGVPRSYKEIIGDLAGPGPKNMTEIDRCMALLGELKMVSELSSEQILSFFVSARSRLEDGWVPFLTKISINVAPNKSKTERLIADGMISCCKDILLSSGLSFDEMEQACRTFIASKNENEITTYLIAAERHKPISQPSVAGDAAMPHRITAQELACVSYSYFTMECRKAYPSNYSLLIQIDRAIAEHFSCASPKEQAGKTVGSVLSQRIFSQKKIADLTYLYAGMTDTVKDQEKRIVELTEETSLMKLQNTKLKAEIRKLNDDCADMASHIEELESEKEQLQLERNEAENRLDYERNRYQQLMSTKEAGLAEQLTADLALELQAIREIADYLDQDDQERIRRRLQRIDTILSEFGGATDA